MSARQEGWFIPAAILADPALTPLEKLVLGITTKLAEGGGVRCSNKYLAETLGVSRASISCTLTRLRAKGRVSGGGPTPPKHIRGSRFEVPGTLSKREATLSKREGTLSKSVIDSNNTTNRQERKKVRAAGRIPEGDEAREIEALLATRGFSPAEARSALEAAVAEINAGFTLPPEHWVSWLSSRMVEAKRAKRVIDGSRFPRIETGSQQGQVSQFSKDYTKERPVHTGPFD